MSLVLLATVFGHTLDVIKFEHGHEHCLDLAILQAGCAAQLCCSHVCSISIVVVAAVKGIKAFG